MEKSVLLSLCLTSHHSESVFLHMPLGASRPLTPFVIISEVLTLLSGLESVFRGVSTVTFQRRSREHSARGLSGHALLTSPPLCLGPHSHRSLVLLLSPSQQPGLCTHCTLS